MRLWTTGRRAQERAEVRHGDEKGGITVRMALRGGITGPPRQNRGSKLNLQN